MLPLGTRFGALPHERLFALGHACFLLQAQFLHHHLAGARHERDLARVIALQILGDDADLFERQIAAHEFRIAIADVHRGHAGQHRAAAEHLGFETLAPAAGLDQFVDQHFHGVGAVAHRIRRGLAGVRAVVGQHEVIHAANAGRAVLNAGRDARAQHGDEHHVFARRVKLVRQQLHAGALEVVVEVQIGGDRQGAAHAVTPLVVAPAAWLAARAGVRAAPASRVSS